MYEVVFESKDWTIQYNEVTDTIKISRFKDSDYRGEVVIDELDFEDNDVAMTLFISQYVIMFFPVGGISRHASLLRVLTINKNRQ